MPVREIDVSTKRDRLTEIEGRVAEATPVGAMWGDGTLRGAYPGKGISPEHIGKIDSPTDRALYLSAHGDLKWAAKEIRRLRAALAKVPAQAWRDAGMSGPTWRARR